MHARGDIGPPQKRLHERRAVVGANFEFEISLARMQADAVHAFHAAHRIVVAAPDRFRAVRVFFDFKIHRQKRRGPMMLRPVEFDAAGNPRPGQADQRRLDDRLVVNQIVAVRLVLQDVDASANFRQNHRADEFIFDPDGLPFSIHRLFRDAIGERQRINFAAAALINALFQKHRVFVRRRGQVGGNHQILHAHLHGVGLRTVTVARRRMFRRRAAFRSIPEMFVRFISSKFNPPIPFQFVPAFCPWFPAV